MYILPQSDKFIILTLETVTNLINTVTTVMPTASNLASTAARASIKRKTPAKPSVLKQRGRKAYPRDENGKMVRPNKKII